MDRSSLPVGEEALAQTILRTINVLVQSFRRDPLNYLCERDIQCELFSMLRHACADATVPTQERLVFAEYHSRIDLVVLRPAGTVSQRHAMYRQEILAAIELKLLEPARSPGWNIIRNDLSKLRKLALVSAMKYLCLGFIPEEQFENTFKKYISSEEGVTTSIATAVATYDRAFVIGPKHIIECSQP